jgi:hypothetical protein
MRRIGNSKIDDHFGAQRDFLEEQMKRLGVSVLLLFGLLFTGTAVSAQEKTEKEESKTPAVRQEGPQARVQIVFTEYEGDKKVKNLPYTLLVRVGVDGKDGPLSKIRMGSRVPIATGGGTPNSFNFQYLDVGTNVDCSASQVSEGRFRLSMMMERSWVEADTGSSEGRSVPPGSEARVGEFREPVIRQFRSDSSVTVREGQTLETNFATDPVSGKVIKLEVTINALK